MTFWLPTAQEEASGWWETPPSIYRLGHWDFLPYTDFSSAGDFWVTRQEETLALARALQCCAVRLGAPPGVLCDMAQDLQRCMLPLMHLTGDDIGEASLLRLADDGPGMCPTLVEEALLLGDEPISWEAQETATLPHEH